MGVKPSQDRATEHVLHIFIYICWLAFFYFKAIISNIFLKTFFERICFTTCMERGSSSPRSQWIWQLNSCLIRVFYKGFTQVQKMVVASKQVTIIWLIHAYILQAIIDNKLVQSWAYWELLYSAGNRNTSTAVWQHDCQQLCDNMTVNSCVTTQLPQQLCDTTVNSCVTTRMSTAVWQHKCQQLCDNTSVNSCVTTRLSTAVWQHDCQQLCDNMTVNSCVTTWLSTAVWQHDCQQLCDNMTVNSCVATWLSTAVWQHDCPQHCKSTTVTTLVETQLQLFDNSQKLCNKPDIL